MAQANLRTAGFWLVLLCGYTVPTRAQAAGSSPISAGAAAQAGSSAQANRYIGVIRSIDGTIITLAPDSGADINIALQPATRILRVAPGEKDLKNATPIQAQDLQAGDRILVSGKTGDNEPSFSAATIVVMKHSDLEARHEQDLKDWQTRGVDGNAMAVDPEAGTVIISAHNQKITLYTSGTTLVRRYSSDSVKFDDAKPGKLSEIRPGDQVRARGERNTDGSEVMVEEIVSGSFKNLAGTIASVDASTSAVSVHDLLSKKTVTVKVTPESQLHQLPAEIAQRFAARLKRGAGSAAGGAESPEAPHARTTTGGSPKRSGASPDLQQLLNHLPALSLSDLHKGDAVVILSTTGSAGVGTAVTVLTGVEPILQAAPNASGASILTPWSLSAPGDSGAP